MRRYWTTLEVRAMRALYSTTTNKELGARLGRSPKAIGLMALKLGLRKSPAFIAAHCRYQHGHASWNKGKTWSPAGSRRTRFKKGHRGGRYRPVGYERVERDGVMVKVGEPRIWKPKARLVWEKHFGEIPAGAIVRLKDGNKLNFATENLMLVRRADHMRLNYRPKRPKPMPAWVVPLKMAA